MVAILSRSLTVIQNSIEYHYHHCFWSWLVYLALAHYLKAVNMNNSQMCEQIANVSANSKGKHPGIAWENAVIWIFSSHIITLEHSWHVLARLCHLDGCRCPGAKQWNHIRYYVYHVAAIAWTLFKWDWKVGILLIFMLLSVWHKIKFGSQNFGYQIW